MAVYLDVLGCWFAPAAPLFRGGFRSVGAAQTAVNRHVARLGREPTETSRQTREDSIRLRSRALGERLAVAYVNGDDDKLVMLNRELARNDSELAKLQGPGADSQRQRAG